MKKVRIGLFLFSIFRFPSPIAPFARILLYKSISMQKQAVWFFLHIACFVSSYWNRLESPLQASFVYNQMVWHGKYLSMISFLPTQYMIFSIRFVVQSVKDFHPCKPIRKTAISHAKQKRQGFHPYRLMFIFSQRRRHDYHMAFSLLESVHRIISPASSLSGKLLHPRKAKRYSFHPYRLMFIFSQRRRHDYLYPNLCVESLRQCRQF